MDKSFFSRFKIKLKKIYFLWRLSILYIIVGLDRKFHFPLAFPRDTAEAKQKQDWLIAILKEKKLLPANAKVRGCDILERSSVKFRSNSAIIKISYDVEGKVQTCQCFAKFAPNFGSLWSRVVFIAQFNHVREGLFNQYFANSEGIPAPRNYFSQFSLITGNICLITEYMENYTQYNFNSYAVSANHLHQVLSNMALLHACFWHKTADLNKMPGISDSAVTLFDALLTSKWSPAARKILTQSWMLMNKPQTLLHGDAWITNMMFPLNEESRFVFIDWQGCRPGNIAFDLAAFLITTLNEKSPLNEEEAKVIYHQYLVEHGIKDYSINQLSEDYNHASLLILAVGAAPYLYNEVILADREAEDVALAYAYNWLSKLQSKFSKFDFSWIASRYQLTENESQMAVAEILGYSQKNIATLESKHK